MKDDPPDFFKELLFTDGKDIRVGMIEKHCDYFNTRLMSYASFQDMMICFPGGIEYITHWAELPELPNKNKEIE